MRCQVLSHKIINIVHLHAKLEDVLVRKDLSAVHAHLVIELEHDVAIRHACRWQEDVDPVLACD